LTAPQFRTSVKVIGLGPLVGMAAFHRRRMVPLHLATWKVTVP